MSRVGTLHQLSHPKKGKSLTVEEELMISKVEYDNFRYTGQDISSAGDSSIHIEMKNYVESLEDIKEIRKANKEEDLTKTEFKEYRKVTGKISWLADSTRLDLSYTHLSMSKKNNSATIADLRNVSRVIKKAKERPSMIRFSRIGDKEDLIVLGMGDTSFKVDEKAVGGIILFLSNTAMTCAVPIYWKSKTLARVSKDAETINLVRMMEDAVFASRQLDFLLFGEYKKRIKVRLFTDSESTLESIASSRQVERKTL